jgi:hypothetical protein
MQLNNKVILTFNKFYISLIKDLKASNDETKAIIKKNYKIIDKLSEDYINFFNEQFGDNLNVFINENEDVTILNDKFIAKDVTIKSILDTITNDIDKKVFWNYCYILTAVLLINREVTTLESKEDNESELEQTDLLFNKVVGVLSKIQTGEDYQYILDEILDDDIKNVLSKVDKFTTNIKEEHTQNEENENKPNENNPFGQMEGSMICNLAKEISNEIDVSNIKVDKPEDILKLMDFTASNNIVGDIIKKVSTKIHDKISSGQLKQEDLFGEAMSMMGMMGMKSTGGGSGGSAGGMGGMAEMMSQMMGGGKGGAGGMAGMADMMSGMSGMMNNPMMAEAMKAMKKGKAVPKPDAFKKESARERLRAKLNARKNKDGDESGAGPSN